MLCQRAVFAGTDDIAEAATLLVAIRYGLFQRLPLLTWVSRGWGGNFGCHAALPACCINGGGSFDLGDTVNGGGMAFATAIVDLDASVVGGGMAFGTLVDYWWDYLDGWWSGIGLGHYAIRLALCGL